MIVPANGLKGSGGPRYSLRISPCVLTLLPLESCGTFLFSLPHPQTF
jgi:hypothetical protein